MKAAKFDYERPATLQAGLQSLQADGGAKAISGSQSLGPMLNLRLARPARLVDLSAVPEMRGVETRDGWVRIGGSVTHAEIEDGVFPLLRDGLMQRVARGIAYRPVRNRGTLAGSLAHADPAADWVLTMTALGAVLELASASGRREVRMDQFMHGAYTTALAEGEVIAVVRIPVASEQARWGYEKFCRKTGEFAEASCCAMFDPARGFARIVVGALDGAPRALPRLAAQVAKTARVPSADDVQQALATTVPEKDAIDRKLMAAVVHKCLAQVFAGETTT